VHIDWATLAVVATVAAAAALTVVLLLAFALVGLSLRLKQPSAPAQRSVLRIGERRPLAGVRKEKP